MKRMQDGRQGFAEVVDFDGGGDARFEEVLGLGLDPGQLEQCAQRGLRGG